MQSFGINNFKCYNISEAFSVVYIKLRDYHSMNFANGVLFILRFYKTDIRYWIDRTCCDTMNQIMLARAPDKMRILISIMSISWPNPIIDHLLKSSHRDDSNKWLNIWLSKQLRQIKSIEVYFTHSIFSSAHFFNLTVILWHILNVCYPLLIISYADVNKLNKRFTLNLSVLLSWTTMQTYHSWSGIYTSVWSWSKL